jgi:hypothetical protein
MGKNPAEKAKLKKNTEAAEGKKEAKAKGQGGDTGPAKKEDKAEAKAAAEAKQVHRHKHHATTPARSARKCKMKGCKRSYKAKGYCKTHYRKWRHGEYGHARYKTCKDMGCMKPMAKNRHGYCEDHFQNYYVKGMEVAKVPVAAPKTPAATENKDAKKEAVA